MKINKMKYSEIKKMIESIDYDLIKEYYANFGSNGLSILNAALNLGIVNDLGNQYEYVCQDEDIQEYKNEGMNHFDEDEEKDDWLESYNGWWFQLMF